MRVLIALLFLSACSSEIYVITPQDCYDSCTKDGSDYVGIVYVDVGNNKGHPTLEYSQAGCLCKPKEAK